MDEMIEGHVLYAPTQPAAALYEGILVSSAPFQSAVPVQCTQLVLPTPTPDDFTCWWSKFNVFSVAKRTNPMYSILTKINIYDLGISLQSCLRFRMAKVSMCITVHIFLPMKYCAHSILLIL